MSKIQLRIFTYVITLILGLFMSCSSDITQMNKGNSSLSLQFTLSSTVNSRSIGDETTHIYYSINDNQVKYDSLKQTLDSSAVTPGDGVVADGGGIADLSLFLVDKSDRIVARKEYVTPSGGETKVVTITMDSLEFGSYTLYAYANCEGNDWFILPSPNETSFTNYKNAALKPVNGDEKIVVNNGRMPLTAHKEVTITYGANSAVVEMSRLVTELSVTLFNKKSTAVNVTDFSLGNIYPVSGYVFKRERVMGEGEVFDYDDNYGLTNLYQQLPSMPDYHPVLPNTECVFYHNYMYENAGTGYSIDISYRKGILVDYEVEVGGGGNTITGKDIDALVKVVGRDLFLRLNEDLELEMVTPELLDDRCFWQIRSAGQNRPFLNVKTSYYINIGSSGCSVSKSEAPLRFGNIQNKINFNLGYNDYWMRYNESSNSFSAIYAKKPESVSGLTRLEFVTYNVGTGEDYDITIDGINVVVEDNGHAEVRNLTEMLRNQKVNLHFTFQ